MTVRLTEVEARVLGSLIEKDMATPEYYPMSLNALVNASNQKSNRDPVVSYDESRVSAAVDSLREKRLATVITGGDNRVPKHGHLASQTLNLGNRELAPLCVLLLRGPQTGGELKGRTERLHAFDDVEAVENCLARMAEAGLAMQLARQPGTREPRWTHLLCGAPVERPAEAVPAVSKPDRVTALEAAVEELRGEMQQLREEFATFRRQFE